MYVQPAKMLLIYLDETLRFDDAPMYEAIVRRLARLGVRGATVHAGVMGFGRHHEIHRKRLFGVSDDRPMTISVIDSETALQGILPEIRAMVPGGLVVLLDAQVLEP
jgi:PII-like signaling protein